ncbi:MAG: hypothetical protein AYK19_17325 [Theionarchaea archaeon DG-70-1]|nr:MAG: hypothetical protein AYK19_17325 [Theionarchaea archaeon DG-70-1]
MELNLNCCQFNTDWLRAQSNKRECAGYLIFFNPVTRVTNLYFATGEDFFSIIVCCKGKVGRGE